jgi:2-polyprenyl-3-methyl-5-hydroxy-6-metoxy-1,4-benzoquinol methylase
MDSDYRRTYPHLFQHHWWWRARADWIVDVLRRLVPSPGSETILDVGCGEGLFFGALSEFGEVQGIELQEGLSASLPIKGIHVGPFDESFVPSTQYSLILMLDVLEHLQDPQAALRQVSRLLAPGGIFLATVPAFQALWTNHDVVNHHVKRYTERELRALVSRAQLQVLEAAYFFQWTCAVKLLVRAIERVSRAAPKPASLPPGWINQPLYLVSRLEHKTLARIRVPFGSSLMLVARQASAATVSYSLLPATSRPTLPATGNS